MNIITYSTIVTFHGTPVGNHLARANPITYILSYICNKTKFVFNFLLMHSLELYHLNQGRETKGLTFQDKITFTG